MVDRGSDKPTAANPVDEEPMPRKYTSRPAIFPIGPAIFPIGPSIAYIELTQGQFSLVDWDDALWLQGWKWFAQWNPCIGQFYAGRQERHETRRQRTISMQAEILGLRGNEVTGDHINRAGLDNRRCNLRAATRSEQKLNQNLRRDNKSGYVGVSFNKPSRKWIALARVDGKSQYFGVHATPEEANAALEFGLGK